MSENDKPSQHQPPLTAYKPSHRPGHKVGRGRKSGSWKCVYCGHNYSMKVTKADHMMMSANCRKQEAVL